MVITGGSKGFGKALAQVFSGHGTQVVISSQTETDLSQTAAELGAEYFVADVTKEYELTS